ncbi:hypothetical protein [Bacillus sp. SIMBA_005]|uniref:hypothetical protein n=1 Tax=Bacillus sp. SIMBA_005 TaxID=3085754 RepID=UPI00397E0F91
MGQLQRWYRRSYRNKKPPVNNRSRPIQNSSFKPVKKSYGLPTGILKATKPLTKGLAVKAVQQTLVAVHYYPDKGAKNSRIYGYYGPKIVFSIK